jgi:hypothetical protein
MKSVSFRYTVFAAAIALSGASHAMTAAGDVAAPAAIAACELPAIPAVSTSTEGVRRVEQRIAQWRQCANDVLASDNSAATQTSLREAAAAVDSHTAAWLSASARYNNGQAAGRLAQTRVERDLKEQIYVFSGSYAGVRYVAPRPDNAVWVQPAVATAQ